MLADKMNNNWVIFAIIVLVLLSLKGAQNEETWEWVDWQGNKRSLTVHRHVR